MKSERDHNLLLSLFLLKQVTTMKEGPNNFSPPLQFCFFNCLYALSSSFLKHMSHSYFQLEVAVLICVSGGELEREGLLFNQNIHGF